MLTKYIYIYIYIYTYVRTQTDATKRITLLRIHAQGNNRAESNRLGQKLAAMFCPRTELQPVFDLGQKLAARFCLMEQKAGYCFLSKDNFWVGQNVP